MIDNNDSANRQIKNLTKLVDINGIINSTLDIGKLLTIIMEIIKDIMNTEASTLLLFDEKSGNLVFKVALGQAGQELTEKYRVRVGQGIAGWVAANRKPLIVNDVYSDERFDPNFDKSTGFKTRAMLCTPLLYKGKLLGVIQAVNPIERDFFDEEDEKLFQLFSNQAALAVQNAIFFQNALDEERINSEVRSAKVIQEKLIGDVETEFGNISFAARSIPAREVGGEFHGLYNIDSRHKGIALGDIHQKGIPGGLNASIISGAVKALSAVRGDRPGVVAKILHDSILGDMKTITSTSLFYGMINIDTSTLSYVNAGIAYPILIRKNVSRYLRFGKRSLVNDDGHLNKVRVNLKKDDFFVIITDGIINIKNRSGHILGLKNIMKRIEKHHESPQELIEDVLSLADEFSGGLGKREDISIIALKVIGEDE